MNPKSKTAIAVLLAAVVLGGGYYLQLNNSSLFQGVIIRGEDPDPELVRREQELGLEADLRAGIQYRAPDQSTNDLTVIAAIENVGDGSVLGNVPFNYVVYINDVEVFSNVDSYTSMDPGDGFSFEYPISREIYQYPDKGTLRFVVDTENSISEPDEQNNSVEMEYDISE